MMLIDRAVPAIVMVLSAAAPRPPVEDLITRPSAYSVDATLDRFEDHVRVARRAFPFLLAGAVKSAYDLALWRLFRPVQLLPEPASPAGGTL